MSFAALALRAWAANDTTQAQINKIPSKSHFIPLLNFTDGNYFHVCHAKKDLRYSVSKFGKQITQVGKITLFTTNFEVLLCEKLRMFQWMFLINSTRKLTKGVTDYLPTEMWNLIQAFFYLKLFLPLDLSSTCFEDGGLKFKRYSNEILLC